MQKVSRALALGALSSVLLLSGAGCGGGDTGGSMEDVTLTYWRVFDNDDTFDEIIAAYTALHPNVTIEYKKPRYEDFEEELVRAMAEGEGPDLFSLHNDALNEYKNLLMPMPASTTVTRLEQQGTLRKEIVVVTQEETTITKKQLKEQFVPTVLEDVILDYQPDPEVAAEERIFGLPLSVDSLTLFYNEDLLNAAGIAEPPATWDAFQDDVIKLTTVNETGTITQSGAALGTADNVDRAPDILSVLMLQNGTEMTDSRGRVAFHTVPEGAPRDEFPGLGAVNFYTDFANPTKEVYSWNDTFSSSFEAFANGQTAFFFGYSYHIPQLASTAPKLNYSIAKLPQIDADARTVNYANYWVEVVSKDTKYADWAWDFLQFAAESENVTSYLSAAEKPTALRSLIATQLDNERLGVFAEQLLTAKSWYHGNDVGAMEEAMRDLIDTILSGTNEPEQAIEDAARVVAQTYE